MNMKKLRIQNFYNYSFCVDNYFKNGDISYHYIDKRGNKISRKDHMGYLFQFIAFEIDGTVSFHFSDFPIINTKEFV